MVREKPAVVADDGFQFASENCGLGILNFGSPIVRRCLRDECDILKGKILRDDRAPAVRAEFDLSHTESLVERWFFAKPASTSRRATSNIWQGRAAACSEKIKALAMRGSGGASVLASRLGPSAPFFNSRPAIDFDNTP
jgi:hypothetical protein